jgi:hypothetical protein
LLRYQQTQFLQPKKGPKYFLKNKNKFDNGLQLKGMKDGVEALGM